MSSSYKIAIGLALLLLCGFVCFEFRNAFSRPAHSRQLVRKDLSYVPGSIDPLQTLDIYLPIKPRRTPTPLILWIHGGAWMAGDKNNPPVPVILERGYALASINYRLSSQSPFPAQIYDCKAALRFLRANADELRIDPAKIGVWGQSAGGHLAALLGSSCDVKKLEGELGNNGLSSRVQAVAEWAGPTDLLSMASQAPANCKIDFKSPTNPVAVLLGKDQSPAAHLAASPSEYVSEDDPPVFILHAEDDDVVPVGQAKEFAGLLKKAKVPFECCIPSDGGHTLSRLENMDRTMDFFDKFLAAD